MMTKIIGAVAVVVIMGFAAYFFLSPSQQTPDQQGATETGDIITEAGNLDQSSADFDQSSATLQEELTPDATQEVPAP